MGEVTILEDRLARLLSDDINLRSGHGNGANGTIDVCVMQAVDWLVGGDGKSDRPSCVDPVLTSFCMRLNDGALNNEFRNKLKPFAPRLANTNFGDAISIRRGFLCADWAIRVAAPIWFDYWAQKSPKCESEALLWAAKLRGVAPIVDWQSAEAGRALSRSAHSATGATCALYVADAASAVSAGSAASAVYADYPASVASAASAAYAASLGYAGYAADAAMRRRLWYASLAFLDQMIAVTEVSQ